MPASGSRQACSDRDISCVLHKHRRSAGAQHEQKPNANLVQQPTEVGRLGTLNNVDIAGSRSFMHSPLFAHQCMSAVNSACAVSRA